MTSLITIAAIIALPIIASFWSHRVSDKRWGVRR